MQNLLVFFGVVCVFFSADGMPAVKKETDNGDKISFSLPRKMVLNDNITLTGLTKPDRKKVTLGLVKGTADGLPDYGNVPCQINLYFPHEGSTRNTITINSVVNSTPTKEHDSGYEVSFILEESSLALSFESFLEAGKKKIQPFIGTDLHATPYTCDWTEDIQFLNIEGDVRKIDTLNFTLG